MTENLTTDVPGGSLDEIAEQRQTLLRNLATHACPARDRLCLSQLNAARLAGIQPTILEDIENGCGGALSLAALTHLALFLGLSETGLPRPQPPGRH